VDGFVALLKDDANFTMPPWLQWCRGREIIRAFFGTAWKTCGGLRLVPTAAMVKPLSRCTSASIAAGMRTRSTCSLSKIS
jgi:hypothetical protein